MGIAFALGVAFLSISAVAWSLLSGGSRAWDGYSEAMTARAESKLRGLFVFADTRKLFVAYVAALLGVPVLLLVLGISPALVALALGLLLVAPRLALDRLARRRRIEIERTLPDVLAQIAGAMRAGSTFTVAIQSMVEEQEGPLGQEFGLLLREQRVGARLEEALDNLGERVRSEEMDLVISAALIAQEVGGNLAEILQGLSETIRRKLEMEGRIRALTAQGVLQGRVVTALPFAILAALMYFEPEATRPIFHSILGWGFLVVILALQFVGSLVIGKIVRIDV